MRTLAIVLALVGSAAIPAGHAAAQAVDADFAAPFIGAWDVTLETPDGAMPLVLSVREEGAGVVVVLGNGTQEQPPITDVSRDGEQLVAEYDMDYQGMPINAEIRIRRNGEGLATDWSFADGMYVTSAAGTKR